jgi:hypothetical protein
MSEVHRPMQHVQGYTRFHWTLLSSGYLLRIAPAAARVTGKQTMMKKHTSFAGHFDGHDNMPVRYHVHRLNQKVQDFNRSH